MKKNDRTPRSSSPDKLADALQLLREDLRSFVTLSMQESESSWQEWLSVVRKDIGIRCWERKQCGNRACPAYNNSCGRCWLIAGTMCGGKPSGKYALKYKTCLECDVYAAEVCADPVDEIYEHLIVLVHNLRDSRLELSTLAWKDGLTGVHNRNYFDLIMDREVKKVGRYGGRFMLFLLDIDNFKSINDKYGHVHGDGVLKEFARILGSSIRETDLLVRFGGDEFVIVRRETSPAERDAMLARIRESFEHWNGEYASECYRLTFSCGAALYDGTRTLNAVIDEADAEMYKNKEQHRKLNASAGCG